MIDTLEALARRTLASQGFRSLYYDTSVCNMHFLDGAGKGSMAPMILLHGIASSAIGYSQLMVPLKRYVKSVIAVDSPGHGWSSVPYKTLDPEVIFQGVLELLDRIITEPVFLYGNSLGGGLTLRYALERPENVKGIILSSPAGAPLSTDEFTTLRTIFNVRTQEDAGRFLDLLYHEPPRFRRLIERFILRLIARPHIQGFFDNYNPEDEDDFAFTPKDLAQLKMPIMFLWGQSERLLPLSCYSYFKEHLPSHAKIERPPGWGHSPHMEHPKDIVERLRFFMLEVERQHTFGVSEGQSSKFGAEPLQPSNMGEKRP
ncbi:MAG: alpha/beta hydrolase [Deltaproteobacteria bacterium]|nr:MAG: alpha/beta hydrolase [Deltaproteobacteria bacterium]